MENILRVRITEMVEKIDARIQQLDKHAKEYQAEGNLESYYSCNIKKVTFQAVLNNLKTILNETP